MRSLMFCWHRFFQSIGFSLDWKKCKRKSRCRLATETLETRVLLAADPFVEPWQQVVTASSVHYAIADQVGPSYAGSTRFDSLTPPSALSPAGPEGELPPSEPTGPTSPSGPTGPSSPSGPSNYLPTYSACQDYFDWVANNSPNGIMSPTLCEPTSPTGPEDPTGTTPTGPSDPTGPTGPTGPTTPCDQQSIPTALSTGATYTTDAYGNTITRDSYGNIHHSSYSSFDQSFYGIEGSTTEGVFRFRYPRSYYGSEEHDGESCESWTESWSHYEEGNLTPQFYYPASANSTTYVRSTQSLGATQITLVSPTQVQTSDGHTLTKVSTLEDGYMAHLYFASRQLNYYGYGYYLDGSRLIYRLPAIDFFSDGQGRGAFVPRPYQFPAGNLWFQNRVMTRLAAEYWDTNLWNPVISWGDGTTTPGELMIGNLAVAMATGDTMLVTGEHIYKDTLDFGGYYGGSWGNYYSSYYNATGAIPPGTARAEAYISDAGMTHQLLPEFSWGSTASSFLNDVPVAILTNGNPFELALHHSATIQWWGSGGSGGSSGGYGGYGGSGPGGGYGGGSGGGYVSDSVRLVDTPNGKQVRVTKQFPSAGWYGAQIIVADDDGFTEYISFSVTVEDRPPVVLDHAFTVYGTKPFDSTPQSVLNGAIDDWPDRMTARLVSGPSNGTLTLRPNGTFVYDANTGYYGTDSFVYQAFDGNNYSNNAVATLNVVNRPPVAGNDSLTISHTREVILPILTNDIEYDDEPLTIEILTQPHLGVLRLSADGKKVSFDPPDNVTFATSFVYRLSDGLSFSNQATVSLNVINNVPTSSNLSIVSSHDRPVTRLFPAVDVDGDNVQLRVKSLPSHGTILLDRESWTYIPDALYLGNDQFTYAYFDGLAESSVATVSLQLVNHAPVALPIAAFVPRSNSVNINLTNVTSDQDGDALSVRIEQQPVDGRLTIHDDGVVLFERWSQDINPAWTDRFVYSLFDGIAWSAQETVTLTLKNSQPVSANDAFNVSTQRSIVGKLTSNDYDADGDVLRVTLKPGFGPQNAKEFHLFEDGSFVYVPQDGFQGIDTFTYEARDPWPVPGSAVATITVLNRAPQALNVTRTTLIDQELQIDSYLLGSDIDYDPVSFRVVSNPTNGIVSLDSSGPLRYLPKPGYVGQDTFTFVASDGEITSSPATVTISVVSPVPSISSLGLWTRIDEPLNSSLFSLSAYANDGHPAKNLPLTWSLHGSVSNGTAQLNTNGTFQFTPTPGFKGTASFGYRAFNGYEYSTPAVATINVGATASSDYFTLVGANQLTGSVAFNDLSLVSQFSSYSINALPNWTGYSFQPVDDALSLNSTIQLNADGTFLYDRPSGFVGTETLQYYIVRNSDNLAVSNVATLTIQVWNSGTGPGPGSGSGNVRPTVHSKEWHVQTGGTLSSGVSSYDPNNNPLTFEFAGNERLVGTSSGSFTYQPLPQFTGRETAKVRAFDGQLYSEWVDLSFEVSNVAPIAMPTTRSVHFSNTVSIQLGQLAFDSNLDFLSYSIVSGPTSGTLTTSGNNTYRYTANAGFLGNDQVLYRVSDGRDASTGTITIQVTNSAPKTNWERTGTASSPDEYWIAPGDVLVTSKATAVAKVVSGPQTGRIIELKDKVHFGEMDLLGYLGLGSPQQREEILRRFSRDKSLASLLDNDFDANGDILRAQLIQPPAQGTLSLSEDGTFTYEAVEFYQGDVSFVYRVTDGAEWSPATTVTIHVANTAPVSRNFEIKTSRNGSAWGAAQDGPLTLVGNTIDRELGNLTFSLLTSPTKGTIVVNPDGSYEYKNTDGLIGTDSFTYKSFDGVLYSEPATVTITIQNNAPVAKNDSYEPLRDYRDGGLFNAVDSVIGDLPTDDPDNDSLSLDFQSGPFHGTFTVDAEGRFVYKPNAGFVGRDRVTYRVTDGLKSSNLATLTFSMKEYAPKAISDTYTMSGFAGEVLSIDPVRSMLRNDTDQDYQALTALLWSPPAPGTGTITLASNGGFVYDPQGFVGETEFAYYANDGVTNSLPTTVKIQVQGAKFTEQSSPIPIDMHQAYIGPMTSFQLMNGLQPKTGTPAQITWEGGSTTGLIQPTGLAPGQPQWQVVPVELRFLTSGAKFVTVKIWDSQNREATTTLEFTVKAKPPQLTWSLTSLPQGMGSAVTIATFRDVQNLDPSEYGATIDWGDSKTSVGKIERVSSGFYQVLGSRAFSEAGTRTVTVTLRAPQGTTTSSSSVSVDSGILFDVTKVDTLNSTVVSIATILASFRTNAPSSLFTTMRPVIYWGDGRSSQATITSRGGGLYDLSGSNVYASKGDYKIEIALTDPSGALNAYTSQTSNPSVVWFAESIKTMAFESDAPVSLVKFYSNPRGATDDTYSAVIGWNDGRGSTLISNMTSSGRWRVVTAPHGYATPGNHVPNVTIQRTVLNESTNVAQLTTQISVASVSFLPAQKFVEIDPILSRTVAKFQLNDSTWNASHLASVIVWSDGVVSPAEIKRTGETYEVLSTRSISKSRELLTSQIHVRSNTNRHLLPVQPNNGGSSGGEGEAGTAPGTFVQRVSAMSAPAFLPIADVSYPGCPNMFQMSISLYIDEENSSGSTPTDKKSKVKQDTDGATIGKILAVNDKDSNGNGVLDLDDNVNGVTTLLGNIAPLTVTLPPPDPSSSAPAPPTNLTWNTSYLRIWKKEGDTYSKLSPGTVTTPPPVEGQSTVLSLYLEAIKPSTKRGDQTIIGTINGINADVVLTLVKANIKVYINNTELPETRESDFDYTTLATPETQSGNVEVRIDVESIQPTFASGAFRIQSGEHSIIWYEKPNGENEYFGADNDIPRSGKSNLNVGVKDFGDLNYTLQFVHNKSTVTVDQFRVHQRDGSFAEDDKYVVNYEGPNVSWTLDIQANDYVGDTPKARIVSHSNPSRGFLTHMMSGTPQAHFLYTPSAGQFGEDSFSYTVVNDHNEYSTAQVQVVVEYRPEVISAKISDLDQASRSQLEQIHYDFLVATTKKILGNTLGQEFANRQGRLKMERLATIASWGWVTYRTIGMPPTWPMPWKTDDELVGHGTTKIVEHYRHMTFHGIDSNGNFILHEDYAKQTADIARLIDNQHVLPHYNGGAPGSPFMAGVEAFVAHKNTRIAIGVAGAAVVVLAGPAAWAAAGTYAGSITIGGTTITAAGVAQAGVAVGTAWSLARAADDIHNTIVEGDRSIMQSSMDKINSYLYNDYQTATNNQILSMDLATIVVEVGPGFFQMMRGAKSVATQAATKSARELTVLQKSCFVANTPILTPGGSKTIEQFRPGDAILSRPENDPTAPVRASMVEEVFELQSTVLELVVNGRLLETTEEHPFYVDGKGWTPAKDLLVRDQLVGHNDQLAVVELVTLTQRVETVYNLRVREDHTYFVGDTDWGFAVWVHNTYDIVEEGGKVIVRKQGQDDIVFDSWDNLFSRYGVSSRGDAIKYLNSSASTLPHHSNHVSNLPFGFKEKTFQRWADRFDEEFSQAGYLDAKFYMQGSAASGVKHSTGVALDARRGIYPKDYDIAIVSPMLQQKASELGIDVLRGPLTEDQISQLGLTSAQDILTKASKGGIQVNFKVYNSVQDVYDYAKTIPFKQ